MIGWSLRSRLPTCRFSIKILLPEIKNCHPNQNPQPENQLSSSAARDPGFAACVGDRFLEKNPQLLDKSLLCFSSAFSIGGCWTLALSFVFQISALKPAISTSLYPVWFCLNHRFYAKETEGHPCPTNCAISWHSRTMNSKTSTLRQKSSARIAPLPTKSKRTASST